MLLVLGSARAQEEPLILTATKPFRNYPAYPNCQPSPIPVYPSDQGKKDGMEPVPDVGMLAGGTEAGTQPRPMFNPNVFGDLIGINSTRVVTLGNGATTVAHGIPLAGRYVGFQITDDESPRPVDRVYFKFNGYNSVNQAILPDSIPRMSAQQELIGFEKTFLQGDASIGMRLPFNQLNGFSDAEAHVVGDLSVIFKFAWINDRNTGNVFSSGLILTLPTGGGSAILADGSTAPHSTLFMPWLGYIYNFDRLYLQGFSSVVVPTDSRDPTILFNTLAAGYWLYRNDEDRILNGVVPVVEMHLNTPLNHRSPDDLVFFQDQLNLTVGSYFVFPRMTLGGAVGMPLVGPRPYSVEAIATLNFRF
jgi:hypothetical protein